MIKSILVVVTIACVILGYGIYVGSTAEVKNQVADFYQIYDKNIQNGTYDKEYLEQRFETICKEYLLGKRSRKSEDFTQFQSFCARQLSEGSFLKEIILDYRNQGLEI